MNTFQKQQAAKLLSCYITPEEIQKSLDDLDIEKAHPVGYINKNGYQKQADGKYKYVGKGKAGQDQTKSTTKKATLPTWFNAESQLKMLKSGKVGGTYNTSEEADHAIEKLKELSPDTKFEKVSRSTSVYELGQAEPVSATRYTLKASLNNEEEGNKPEKKSYSDLEQGNVTKEEVLDTVLNGIDSYIYNGTDHQKYIKISTIVQKILAKGAVELHPEEIAKISKEVREKIVDKYKKQNPSITLVV